MVNTEEKILKILESSTCFGLAHDSTVPECKQCDVSKLCISKCEGANIPTPNGKAKKTPVTASTVSKPKATAPAKKEPKATAPKKTAKTPAPINSNLPDFKPMSLDELKDMAAERSVEWKDYGSDQITRMRLIMALKKSFE